MFCGCVFVFCVCVLTRPGMLVLCVNMMAASGKTAYGGSKLVCLKQRTDEKQLKVTLYYYFSIYARSLSLFRLFSFDLLRALPAISCQVGLASTVWLS